MIFEKLKNVRITPDPALAYCERTARDFKNPSAQDKNKNNYTLEVLKPEL
jgi:hypothetical protein